MEQQDKQTAPVEASKPAVEAGSGGRMNRFVIERLIGGEWEPWSVRGFGTREQAENVITANVWQARLGETAANPERWRVVEVPDTADTVLTRLAGCDAVDIVRRALGACGPGDSWAIQKLQSVLTYLYDPQHYAGMFRIYGSLGMSPEEPRQISCGCCTAGCVCLNHMDIPRGIRPQVCAVHSKTGEVEYLRGGAA